MTLNGVMVVILSYFSESNSVDFGEHCVKVVEDISKLSVTEI